MPRNMLLIGLGGTGVWSATYLKRDLIQTYGKVPENVRIVCFDTISLDPTKVERMRREGLVREDYGLPSIGGIALERGSEYFYVGGDARPICEQLRDDITRTQYPTIRPWLQFEWYLRYLQPAQMDLDAGASWRQFGRLAFFINETNIYNILQSAIDHFPQDQHLDIVIVSSLAGGTGSGMFVDIALLVRHFAERRFAGTETGYTLFGIFAIASTFDATGADRQSLYRNCFAAWRTLDRFLRTAHRKYSINHPTHTHIYDKSLFDYIAIVGGLRGQNNLNEIRPELGVFPSISDFLLIMIDDAIGNDLTEFVFRNSGRIEDEFNMRLQEWERRRYCFSFGTYSYVYPANDITIELTLRFAKEFLDSYFLRRIEVKGVGEGRTYELVSVAEPLTYRDDFCKNPGDPDLQRFLNLLPQVALSNPAMAKGFTMESMITMLRNYDPKTPPEERQRDEEIISRRVWAKPSRKYGDDLENGAYRIPTEVEGYKAVHLGHLVDPETQLRLEGEFQQVLGRFSARLKERFAIALGRRVVELLNGTANNALTAEQRALKGENLCLAIFFVERLIIDIFKPFINACKEAQKEVLRQFAAQQNIVESVRNEMVEARHATLLTPIPIISYLRAHNLQYAYIAAEQELIDIECKYHCFEALIQTTEGFIEVAERILQELRRWKEILVDDLYDEILRRLDSHRIMRDRLNQIRVRRYLTDQSHEESLYSQYRNSPTEASHNKHPMDDALDSLRWHELGSWLDATGRLTLVRYDGASTNRIAEFSHDKDHNRDILLKMVQPYFEPIHKQTVLDRLLVQFPRGADFVSKIQQEVSPMTTVNVGESREGVTIALPSAQTDAQRLFRGSGKPNPDDPRTVEDAVARLDQGSGRYILREFANRQVAMAVKIVLGIRGEEAINAESAGGRRPQDLYDESSPKAILHLFPAEINATDYESRLQSIGEAYRYFHPEVVILLEDKNRFEAFAMAYLMELVKPTQVQERGNFVWTYVLDLDGQSYRLTLKTVPVDHLSLLLEAANYFVSGKDAVNVNRTFAPNEVLRRCYERLESQTEGRIYKQLFWIESVNQKLNPLSESQDQRLKDLAVVMKLKLKEIEENVRNKLGPDLAELLSSQENRERLKIFCFAWLYNLVKAVRERKDTKGNSLFDWVLEIDNERWWLSEQGHRSDPWAIFLRSVRQFVIEGRCASDQTKSIEFSNVNKAWLQRVENLSAQEFEQDIKVKLENLRRNAQGANQEVQTLLQFLEDIIEEEINTRRRAEEFLRSQQS